MFKELSGKIKLTSIEEGILEYWDKNDIFLKSIQSKSKAPEFVFYEGPPTANGRPGIHHVMSRTIKDVVCRYKTMKGFKVDRKAGWDTHGLPVEIEVEKKLNIEGKEQIEAYGITKFNEACKESVFKYKQEWDDLTRRIAFWLDLDNPYITFQNEYIESIWWILKNFHKRNLIYKGFKILPYCPRCETPLSSHEVSLGYREVKDPSIYVKFKLSDEPNTYFLVWTTTPWTLISNVALAFHPEVEYLKVKFHDEYLILAESRANIVLKDEFEIIEKRKGWQLEGIHYDRLFDYVTVEQEAFYSILGEFVTTEDGTGIVHIAPAFGEDDYQVGKKYELPIIRPVDKSGTFEEEILDFKNTFVKKADPSIIQNLKDRRLLFKTEMVEHSYPHCWRCDSPLLYYARDSWYIRTTQFKEDMLRINKQINWYPEEVGEGRFGEWLKNNVDWALSRDRYWGTPLNIWICENCHHEIAIESIKELTEKGKNVPENIDLHRPHVDDVIISCPDCGKNMYRTPEVIDVWFDSGSMPYAQYQYPFGDKTLFDRNFPADFICEGVDQTRGWFYSLLAISTMLFNKPAFKNIVVNELILDKEGQKMSKSRGNAVVPEEVISQYGADPLRWYFLTVSSPWVPKRFDMEGIAEVYRKFFDTLFNTYGFFSLYANIDKFDPETPSMDFNKRPEIDRWILSLLYSLVAEVNDKMEIYDITRAARLISDFVLDNVSNWYVRRNRRRFWKGEMNQDKLAAYQTLQEILYTITHLIAPFVPFVAEELYLNLKTSTMPESVHLSSFPELNDRQQKYRDIELEKRMQVTQQVVSLARAIRNEVKIKVRQPLPKIIVSSPSQSTREAVLKMSQIISDEINVKEVAVTEKISDLVSKKAKPIYKQLGPKVGKLMKKVADIIENLNEETIEHLQKAGIITLDVENSHVHVSEQDVEIIEEKRVKNLEILRDGNLVIALSTTISPELEREGIAREFVNRIQNLRKEAGYEVTDRIKVYFDADKNISKAIQNLAEYIKTETLAVDIFPSMESGDIYKKIKINNSDLAVSLQKAIN
jgi:isoleucyl-tRNA synthetase